MIEIQLLHLLGALLLCYILGVMSKLIWDGAIEAEVSRREFKKESAAAEERIEQQREKSTFN